MESAFYSAKDADTTMLTHPLATAPMRITTDSSDRAVGALLEQEVNGTWEPLGFFLTTLHAVELRYSTFNKEFLTIYLAIKHFKHMVEGRPFIVYTDHKSLTHAMKAATDY